MNNEKLKNLAADYVNLPSILSLALAVCAGYFFQARYIAATIGNLTAARIIAVICCVALAVLVKGLMQQIKQNAKLDIAVEKYAKPALGIVLVIFAVIIDAMTSNASIDDAHTANVAAKVTASVDRAAILDLKQQRERDQNTLANLDSAAKKLGAFAFAQRRLALQNAITEKSRLIAEAEKAHALTVAQANNLLAGTVSGDVGINGALWGFYLMALIIGLEMFAPVTARPGATAMVTTLEQTDSISHTRRFSERIEHVPVTNVELQKPKNWEDACRMKFYGNLNLSIREIVNQFGAKKWEVERMLNELKEEKRLPLPIKSSISGDAVS